MSSRFFVAVNNDGDGLDEESETFIREVEYFAHGLEICPTTGRNHDQIFIIFHKKIRAEQARRWMGLRDGMYCKRAYAPDLNEARLYALKEGYGFEWGTWKEAYKGRRTDIEFVREAVKDGKTMNYIIDNCESGQALRLAETVLKYKGTRREWMTELRYYRDDADVKHLSRTAFFADGVEGRFLWDGYDGEEDVVFTGTPCMDYIKKYIGSLPLRVEVKGGTRQFLAKRIWVRNKFCPVSLGRGNTQPDLTGPFDDETLFDL